MFLCCHTVPGCQHPADQTLCDRSFHGLASGQALPFEMYHICDNDPSRDIRQGNALGLPFRFRSGAAERQPQTRLEPAGF